METPIVPPTAEELAAEQAEAKVPTEDEVRAKVIEEFGFDEETEKDRIDKAVAKDIEGRKKLSKAIGQKVTYRTAAQEAAAKVPKKEEADAVAKKEDISSTDMYILIDAKVPREDIKDVTEYATLKGISIEEALKTTTVKTILAEKAEERASAIAANTGQQRRAPTKLSGDALLDSARKGELPESEADMDRLAEARLESKRAKK